MKNIRIAVIGIILCTTSFITDVQAQKRTTFENHRNVRVLLEITEGDKPTSTFSIVGTKGRLKLDNIANMVKIDDKEVPTMLSFETALDPQDDDRYSIGYSYSSQMPIIVGTIKSKDGKVSSRYEYKNLGASGTVNMTIGDKLEILKDPKRSVVLKLESADSVTE